MTMQMVKRNCAPVVRVQMVREKEVIYQNPLDSPREVVNFATSLFSCLDREYVYAIYVDAKGHINAVENISIGSLDHAVLEPREILKSAILSNSISFFILHNHPSGDCSPSKEDESVTRRLREVGKLMGIEMRDHIIIGSEKFYSFETGKEEYIDNDARE